MNTQNANEASSQKVTSKIVPDHLRINHVANLFGINFPMRLEPFIYGITSQLCSEYQGGLWTFWELSNGGFYISLRADQSFSVSCENGFEGKLSGDALGIVACLYAYSHLSFGDDSFSEACGIQFHLLRALALDHPDCAAIFQAID